MAKYVFEHRSYGLYPQGEFLRETDQMVFWTSSRNGKERRGRKPEHIVLETTDPEAVEAAYLDEYRRHSNAVNEAEAVVAEAKKKRVKAAMAAALAKAEG